MLNSKVKVIIIKFNSQKKKKKIELFNKKLLISPLLTFIHLDWSKIWGENIIIEF